MKLKYISIIALVVSALTACGGSVPAPTPNSAAPTLVTLQGQLTDAATGEPIVNARIDIGSRTALTNSSGHYEIANVQANSGTTVSRDYQATVTLTGVTAPINMTNTATTPRYPNIKFTMPVTAAAGTTAGNHDFKVGKLSATIKGVVGDSTLLPLGGANVELQDNTTGMVGNVIRTTTTDTATATLGQYSFANVEAGVDYKLVGHSSDATKQGNITTGKLADNQTLQLSLSSSPALILAATDTYSPRIIKVSPDNNADIAPGSVNVVFTFNEPIRQDAYSIPNLSVTDNIYHDINVSYGGRKAAGNYAHTMSWNATFDALTINLPATGISSKFTVDLSLLSPTSATALGKLKDLSGNALEKSPVLTAGNLLAFTTNGGVLAVVPVILSPDAPSLDRNATSVTLDWQPATGATKGYNIYRSTSNSLAPSVAEPFIQIAGPVTASIYTDTQTLSGFNLLPLPEVAQSYAYRVTSINSDLIESSPSNEVLVKDVVAPTPVGVAAAICVTPGGESLTVTTTPATLATNGQLQIIFSEPMAVSTVETISSYTAIFVSAVKLISPTTVVLDFLVPINCANTNTVVLGNGITDVAGNPLAGSLTQRTLTYVP
jgi:Bacterial Ig-like domain